MTQDPQRASAASIIAASTATTSPAASDNHKRGSTSMHKVARAPPPPPPPPPDAGAQQLQGPAIFTFALKHRPRATRASVPKVRTGCKTCKKRHVKCDETKPSCQRCVKWKGFCEGYDLPADEAESAAPARPRTTAAQHARQAQQAVFSSSSSVTTTASPRKVKPEPGLDSLDLQADVVYVDAVAVPSHSQQSAGMVVPFLKRERGGGDNGPSHYYHHPPNAPVFPLEPNYNSIMFASESEKAYFDSWLTIAPNLGGGWFPSHLWTSTIPQLCRDEPAVRFAAIAVGAMAQAMSPALLGKSSYHLLDSAEAEGALEAASPTSAASTDGSASASVATSVVRHYRNALTYIGHAMRLTYLGSGSGGGRGHNNTPAAHAPEKERAAVMCCLLFVCFEALQGNRENAVRHITSGLQIVDQFVARNSLQPATRVEAAAIESTQKTTLQHPHRTPANEQRRLDALAHLLTSSPAPYILEDEVMQVFRRLDFQAWSLGVFHRRRTRPADITLQALDALSPDTIPRRFDTLDDARRWWDIVQHWVLQFPRYMVVALQRFMDANPQASMEAEARGRMLDICDVPNAHEIQREYIECLRRWYDAFEPLYSAHAPAQDDEKSDSERTSDSESKGEHAVAFLQAASLKVQYLLAEIGVTSLVYSDYKTMYTMTPQFRELNRLAALILPKQPRYTWSPFGGSTSVPSSSSSSSNNSNTTTARSFGGDLFTMDNGPTMAIFVVSCKCRCAAVRDEATRLLASYPRRDGFWDSKVLASIAQWNRIIEDENVEGSLDEQWHRLRQREAIFDDTRPQVAMTAWVKNKQRGCFELKTQIVKWDSR